MPLACTDVYTDGCRMIIFWLCFFFVSRHSVLRKKNPFISLIWTYVLPILLNGLYSVMPLFILLLRLSWICPGTNVLGDFLSWLLCHFDISQSFCENFLFSYITRYSRGILYFSLLQPYNHFLRALTSVNCGMVFRSQDLLKVFRSQVNAGFPRCC